MEEPKQPAGGNDPAPEEEEEFDEEYFLKQAIAMSLEEPAKPEPKEEKQDLKNIVTTDFVKGLVDELNLDVDDND